MLTSGLSRILKNRQVILKKRIPFPTELPPEIKTRDTMADAEFEERIRHACAETLMFLAEMKKSLENLSFCNPLGQL